MDHTEPLQAFQHLNIILTRPSQAHDEARAASVNTVGLGTPWHIIECLYFLFSLLNNGELRSHRHGNTAALVSPDASRIGRLCCRTTSGSYAVIPWQPE